MSEVGKEDADGFINLNVRVHRDDILAALDHSEDDEDNHAPRIGAALFRRVAQAMADKKPFSGGDAWEDAIWEAWGRVMMGEGEKKKEGSE